MKNNVKIAKELVKLAKQLMAEDTQKQIFDLAKRGDSNINKIEELVNDDDFTKLIKTINASKNMKVAFKPDDTIKVKDATWESKLNGLQKCIKTVCDACRGKGRYFIAGAAALIFFECQDVLQYAITGNKSSGIPLYQAISQIMSLLKYITIPMMFQFVQRFLKTNADFKLDDLKEKYSE